jgi:PqqD family protein of HPr-rel-A system
MDPKKRLGELAISDSGFVFDPLTGQSYTVNRTGCFLLQRLKEGAAPEQLPALLTEAFEVQPGDDPALEAREFLLFLREAGLLAAEQI